LRRCLVPLLTAACLLTSVAFTYHFIGSSNLVPRGEKVVHPIGNGDYALQYYYATLGGRFLHDTGTPYGYDPRFLSGYVKTPVYYPSSLPFEFALYLIPGVPPALAFNWTVFVLLALTPLLIYRAAANFGLNARERLVALMLLVVPPQALEPQLWLYTIMQAAGMVAFIFASFMSVYTVSLVYRFLVDGRWSAVVPLSVAAPLLFPIHPTTAIFTVVPLVVLYLRTFRRITLRQHVAMWSIAILVLAALWPWIHGYLLFSHYSDLHAFDQEGAKNHFSAAAGSLLGPLSTFLASPSLGARIPLVLGGLGLVMWWKARDRDHLWIFGSQIFALTVVTYYGTKLGLAATAPGRFTLPLALYLFMPTAVAVVRLFDDIRGEFRRLPLTAGQRYVLAAGLLLLLPDAVRVAMPPNIRTRATLQEMQIASGYNAKPAEFGDWLEENTDATGRILHEETSRFGYRYYGTYLAALMPLRMDREFANGPAPFPLLQQNVLQFMAGQLQERPLEEFEPADVSTLLERYNVRWVLCWSDAAKAYFARAASVDDAQDAADSATATLVSTFEDFELYRIDGDRSFFLKGSGEVAAEPNSITVTNSVADGDSLILRYHWDENLKVPPPLELFPFPVPGDPVPFIGVRHPTPSFRITFDY
jgi:hypothetical protein